MAKRAVLYARVSGDDRQKEHRNLSGQLDMCRKYALECGYEVVTELAEDDRGASGASFDLPQLGHVLEMARGHEFDVLVTREIDRLSRKLSKQLIVEQELKRAKVQIEYVLGEYPDTPEGNLMKHVRAVVAEYEREKINERTMRARKLKVESGNVIVHGRPPYGYRLEKVGGKNQLVIYEPEAKIVKLIFEWYLEGDEANKPLPFSEIARRLTQMGVPTSGDGNKLVHKERSTGEWCRSSVAAIISNETYTGTWYYGKYEREGNIKLVKRPREDWIAVDVPAIIDQKTFRRAKMQRKNNQELSPRNRKNNYLLSGHLVCGTCGYRMSGMVNNNGYKPYWYYRCNGSGKRQVRPCKSPSFNMETVDNVVWAYLVSIFLDPEALRAGLQEQQTRILEEQRPLQDRLDIVDELIQETRTQLDRLLDLYLGGEFTKELLAERKHRLEETLSSLAQERVALTTQLDTATLSSEQIDDIMEFADHINRGLEIVKNQDDLETKQRLLDWLAVKVTLAVENGEKIAYVQHIFDTDRLLITNTTS